MKVAIGLGNPGKEYEETRHNAGRNAVMALAKKIKALAWEENKKALSLTAVGEIGKGKILLVTPQTFMNKSGKAVEALGLKARDVLLVHDDSDIELGKMKFSFGRRSAGHKGVESVMRVLKRKDFWRLRIGVQKARRAPADRLVLMKFTPPERKIFARVLKHACEAIEIFFSESPEKAMSQWNK